MSQPSLQRKMELFSISMPSFHIPSPKRRKAESAATKDNNEKGNKGKLRGTVLEKAAVFTRVCMRML